MALTGATGLAKCAKIATPEPMRAGLLRTSLRFLTWCCVAVLAFLSLLPAQDMVRTGFPGQLEHFVAYAGSAAIATAGYGLNRSATRVIGCFWLYAGILEYLQHFSPGRHPAFLDFAASAMGSLCGGVAVALLWRHRSTLPAGRDAA
jgi:VanZ family protein